MSLGRLISRIDTRLAWPAKIVTDDVAVIFGWYGLSLNARWPAPSCAPQINDSDYYL